MKLECASWRVAGIGLGREIGECVVRIHHVMRCVADGVDAGNDGDASIAFAVLDRSWTRCILYRSLPIDSGQQEAAKKVETTLPLAFCRRKGHVTFAMVPIALGLGTGRSASVALLAACVGRQQFLRVRESALAALETAQAAKWAARPEPLLSKRWIGSPRCAPRKVDPRIPLEPPHCPTMAGPSTASTPSPSPSPGHVPHPIRPRNTPC